MIEIIVNGSPRKVPANSTIADLVAELELPADGIAVAVDRAVVPRSAHPSTALASGAQVEVIRAVGGG